MKQVIRKLGKQAVCFFWKWLRFFLDEYDEARILTNAATITLFLFISVFPLLMVILTIIPLFPITLNDLMVLLESAVPDELAPFVRSIVEELYPKSVNGSVLSITIVLTLWAASSGVSWLVRGVNDAYRSKNNRTWLKRRLVSLLYTAILVLVIVVTMMCFVFGQNLQEYLISTFPGLAHFTDEIRLIRNLTALAVVDVFVTLVYHFFPGNRTFFLHQLPGALFATGSWYLFSKIYSYYLKTVADYSYTYGSLAAIVSMIIWLFISMNIILLGGEVNYLWNRHQEARRKKRMPGDGREEKDSRLLCDPMKRLNADR
ncbi:MAG: YihY/virulence factor BrkB family protein [Lachnospiraceae bacterium]|nr:YihY/virulence factor BrkB family protein [Lachnospiraceae bacterium]